MEHYALTHAYMFNNNNQHASPQNSTSPRVGGVPFLGSGYSGCFTSDVNVLSSSTRFFGHSGRYLATHAGSSKAVHERPIAMSSSRSCSGLPASRRSTSAARARGRHVGRGAGAAQAQLGSCSSRCRAARARGSSGAPAAT